MIPLVLLVGFLGSGKTTFLRKILPLLQEKGRRPSVVINDYQNAKVDAALLAELAPVVEAVSGSCVCCGSRDEFLDLLGKISIPGNGVLLVEANGTTDPVELLEILAMDPRAARFGSPVQLSLADAKRWQKRFWNNELERQQVSTAAWLHWSRSDEVPAARLAAVKADLRKWNETAFEIGPEEFAEFLAEMKAPPRSRARASGSGTGHHHAHVFSAVQIPLSETLDRPALEAWLDRLPERVLRAKGLAVLGEEGGGRFVFQKVREEAASFVPLGGPTPLSPLAVLIGAGLDEAELMEEARRAGVSPP